MIERSLMMMEELELPMLVAMMEILMLRLKAEATQRMR